MAVARKAAPILNLIELISGTTYAQGDECELFIEGRYLNRA